MTSRLLGSLDVVEQILARLGRKVVELLQPGLARTDIQARLEASGLPAVPELVTLYEWRNGTDATTGVGLDDLHFVPGFYYLSLEDSLADYKEFIKSPRWSPFWLPVFANGGGDFLAADLTDNPRVAAVRHFRIEQADHPVEYNSLEDMVATYAAAYQRGLFYVDANGFLEMDDNAYAPLAAARNPAVAWWAE